MKNVWLKPAAVVAGVALVLGVIAWAAGFSPRRLLSRRVTSTPLVVPSGGKPGFTRLAPEQTGITFSNDLSETSLSANRVLGNGSGVALGDYDGDGLCDMYLCRLDGDNVLYRNLGSWKFEDVTAKSGVAVPNTFATGATFADVDGDGDLDLLVTSIPGTHCFVNNGNGTFTDATSSAGLTSAFGNMSMALADVDGDGDLDLYVASYRTDTVSDSDTLKLQMVDGKLTIPPELRDRLAVVDGRLQERGEPDVLYLNDGKGRFSAVSWTGGAFFDEDGSRLAQAPLDWGLGATFRDMNGDGKPDIYVCNDFASADTIWINQGDGRFRAIDRLALRSTSATSMGVDFADVDRDGNLDIMVVDMLSRSHKRRNMQMVSIRPTETAIGQIDNRPQIGRNTLFHNRGDGTFEEIANYSGVAASDWSYGTLFADVDLDGYEDLLIANGFPRDVQDGDTNARIDTLDRDKYSVRDTSAFYPRLETPNVAFRNRGDLTFEEVGHAWGLDTTEIGDGEALADLDGDGDLDLVVNNLQAPVGVYRNDSSAPRVAVRLVGDAPNEQGIGAKVALTGGPVPQSKEVTCGGGYLSGSDPLAVFATGSSTGGMTLEVTWRSGARSTVANVQPNTLYSIYESGAGGAAAPPSAAPPALFQDASQLLRHTHHENDFDDFARQPLLPHRISRSGPGVAFTDLDGDGDDDLVVGSGAGGATSVYLNSGSGSFTLASEPSAVSRDETGIAASASTGVLVGVSNFEDGTADGESVARLRLSSGALLAEPGVAGQLSSTGPIALADVDGDGDLDLFVGGRTIPGRYPEAATSRLLRNDDGQFVLDVERSAALASIGLVSGAVFSDVDGDGDPDLVLALEWGPVRVLRNDGGRFTDATEQLGLAPFVGWWNGVTAGDFDEDGRMDLVATNWGLNSPYQADKEHPATIFYGERDSSGAPEPIEAYRDRETGAWLPMRRYADVVKANPAIRSRFPTFESYGAATLEQIYPGLVAGPHVAATTLASTVFLNRGDHFEAVELPPEAQMAPAFGVAVGDLDGDGHEDLFLAQNDFDLPRTMPRCDAGRGLFLKGDGSGRFAAVPGQTSGIKVYGEGRGAALGDFDRDGRLDLVVAENGAATKLYRNAGATPGLRVRLVGGAGNPEGVGAAVRLVWGDRKGPVREVHAGSGYLSQDSAAQVFGSPQPASAVWVRWPGGHETTTNVPARAKEIVVDASGTIRVDR